MACGVSAVGALATLWQVGWWAAHACDPARTPWQLHKLRTLVGWQNVLGVPLAPYVTDTGCAHYATTRRLLPAATARPPQPAACLLCWACARRWRSARRARPGSYTGRAGGRRFGAAGQRPWALWVARSYHRCVLLAALSCRHCYHARSGMLWAVVMPGFLASLSVSTHMRLRLITTAITAGLPFMHGAPLTYLPPDGVRHGHRAAAVSRGPGGFVSGCGRSNTRGVQPALPSARCRRCQCHGPLLAHHGEHQRRRSQLRRQRI